ncbi:hypothetical protein LSH36_278g06021, partial [Paralvinella palmiformis]
ASSCSSLREETSRSVLDDLVVVASANPPATTTTGSSVGLYSIRWFERSRGRSDLFPSSVIYLDQFDGRGTDALFTILR